MHDITIINITRFAKRKSSAISPQILSQSWCTQRSSSVHFFKQSLTISQNERVCVKIVQIVQTIKIVWLKIKMVEMIVQMVHRSDDVKPLKGFPTGCIIGTRLLAICKKMSALEPISKRKTSKQQQKCRRWRQFQKEKHCKRQIYNNKTTPPLLEAIYKEKRNWRQFI